MLLVGAETTAGVEAANSLAVSTCLDAAGILPPTGVDPATGDGGGGILPKSSTPPVGPVGTLLSFPNPKKLDNPFAVLLESSNPKVNPDNTPATPAAALSPPVTSSPSFPSKTSAFIAP